ncbi:unnamed protein product [Echinostoma caproni]|uniref:Protein kinase domain-containing protein n=1 Tax=Echinostoma caproni TaxID=27848 RepID=A0A183ANM4_9TREM|nr:unnamed protein product [Echinostoma caproni]
MQDSEPLISKSTRFRGHFILDKSRERLGGGQDKSFLEASVKCSEIQRPFLTNEAIEAKRIDRTSRYRIRLEYEFDSAVDKTTDEALASVELLSSSEASRSTNILSELKPILRSIVNRLVETHHSEAMENKHRKSTNYWRSKSVEPSSKMVSSVVPTSEIIRTNKSQSGEMRRLIRKAKAENLSCSSEAVCLGHISSPIVEDFQQTIPPMKPFNLPSFRRYECQGSMNTLPRCMSRLSDRIPSMTDYVNGDTPTLLVHAPKNNEKNVKFQPQTGKSIITKLEPLTNTILFVSFTNHKVIPWSCLRESPNWCPLALPTVVHVADHVIRFLSGLYQLYTYSVSTIHLASSLPTEFQTINNVSDCLVLKSELLTPDRLWSPYVSRICEPKATQTMETQEILYSIFTPRAISQRRAGTASNAVPLSPRAMDKPIQSIQLRESGSFETRSLDRHNHNRPPGLRIRTNSSAMHNIIMPLNPFHRRTNLRQLHSGRHTSNGLTKNPTEHTRSRFRESATIGNLTFELVKDGVNIIPATCFASFDRNSVGLNALDSSRSNVLGWNNNSTGRKIQKVVYYPIVRPVCTCGSMGPYVIHRRVYSTDSCVQYKSNVIMHRSNCCHCSCPGCTRSWYRSVELSDCLPSSLCRRIRRRRRRRCCSLSEKGGLVYLDLDPGYYALHKYSPKERDQTPPPKQSTGTTETAQVDSNALGLEAERNQQLSVDTENNSAVSAKHHCHYFTFLGCSCIPIQPELEPSGLLGNDYTIGKRSPFRNWRRKLHSSVKNRTKIAGHRPRLIAVELPLMFPSELVTTCPRSPRPRTQRCVPRYPYRSSYDQYYSRSMQREQSRGSARKFVQRSPSKGYLETKTSLRRAQSARRLNERLVRSQNSSTRVQKDMSAEVVHSRVTESESSQAIRQAVPSNEARHSTVNLVPCISPSRKCLADGQFYFFASSPDSMTSVRSECVKPAIQSASAQTDYKIGHFSAECLVGIGEALGDCNSKRTDTPHVSHSFETVLEIRQPNVSTYIIPDKLCYENQAHHAIASKAVECVMSPGNDRSATDSISQFRETSSVQSLRDPLEDKAIGITHNLGNVHTLSTEKSRRAEDESSPSEIVHKSIYVDVTTTRESSERPVLRTVRQRALVPSIRRTELGYSTSQAYASHGPVQVINQPSNSLGDPTYSANTVGRLNSKNVLTHIADRIWYKPSQSCTFDKSMTKTETRPPVLVPSASRQSCRIGTQLLEDAILVIDECKFRSSFVQGTESLTQCTLEMCAYNSPIPDLNIAGGDINRTEDDISEPVEYNVFARTENKGKRIRPQKTRQNLSTSVTQLSTPTDSGNFDQWSSVSLTSPVVPCVSFESNRTRNWISMKNLTASSTNIMHPFDGQYASDNPMEILSNHEASTTLHDGCVSGIPLDTNETELSFKGSLSCTPVVTVDTGELMEDEPTGQFMFHGVGDVSPEFDCPSEESSLELDMVEKPNIHSPNLNVRTGHETGYIVQSYGPCENVACSSGVFNSQDCQPWGTTTESKWRSRRVRSLSPNVKLLEVTQFLPVNQPQDEELLTEELIPWKIYNPGIHKCPNASKPVNISLDSQDQQTSSLRWPQSQPWCRCPSDNIFKVRLAQATPLSGSPLARRVLALYPPRNSRIDSSMTRNYQSVDTNNSNSCMLNDSEPFMESHTVPPNLSISEPQSYWNTGCVSRLKITNTTTTTTTTTTALSTSVPRLTGSEKQIVESLRTDPKPDQSSHNIELDTSYTETIRPIAYVASNNATGTITLSESKLIVSECFFITEDMSIDNGDSESNHPGELDESSCSVRLDEPDLISNTTADPSSVSDSRFNCRSAPGYYWYLFDADSDSWIPHRELIDLAQGDDLIGALDLVDLNYCDQESVSHSAFLSLDAVTDYSEADSCIPSQIALNTCPTPTESGSALKNGRARSLQSFLPTQIASNPISGANHAQSTDLTEFQSFSDRARSGEKNESVTFPQNCVRLITGKRESNKKLMNSQKFVHTVSDHILEAAIDFVDNSFGLLTAYSWTVKLDQQKVIHSSGQRNRAGLAQFPNQFRELTYSVEIVVWNLPHCGFISNYHSSVPYRYMYLKRSLSLLLRDQFHLPEKALGIFTYWDTLSWNMLTETEQWVLPITIHSLTCSRFAVTQTTIQWNPNDVICTDQYCLAGTMERQVETVSVCTPLCNLARRGFEPQKRTGLCLSTRSFSDPFKSAWAGRRSVYRAPENICHPNRMSWETNVDCLPALRRKRLSETLDLNQWFSMLLRESSSAGHGTNNFRCRRRSMTVNHRTATTRNPSHDGGSIDNGLFLET